MSAQCRVLASLHLRSWNSASRSFQSALSRFSNQNIHNATKGQVKIYITVLFHWACGGCFATSIFCVNWYEYKKVSPLEMFSSDNRGVVHSKWQIRRTRAKTAFVWLFVPNNHFLDKIFCTEKLQRASALVQHQSEFFERVAAFLTFLGAGEREKFLYLGNRTLACKACRIFRWDFRLNSRRATQVYIMSRGRALEFVISGRLFRSYLLHTHDAR